jgi:hypothetical protein
VFSFATAQSSELDHPEHYKNLVTKARQQKWAEVDSMLAQHFPADQKNPVIESVRRLNSYYNKPEAERDPRVQDDELFQKDNQALNRAFQKLSASASVAISAAQKLEQYLGESSILSLYVGAEKEKMRSNLRKGLSTWIEQNHNRWPGNERLKVSEQIFWNIHALAFGINTPEKWQDFRDFCEPYLRLVGLQSKKNAIITLLPIYQAYPTIAEREAFLGLFSPYLDRMVNEKKPRAMAVFLSLCEELLTAEETRDFLGFFDQNFGEINVHEKPEYMAKLLPVYKALSTAAQRAEFVGFWGEYLAVESGKRLSRIISLLPIHQAFFISAERIDFLAFFDPYLNDAMDLDKKLSRMTLLFPIYKGFSTPESRWAFLEFCQPFFGMNNDLKIASMTSLFPIYQALPNPMQREAFFRFCEPYTNTPNKMQKAQFMKELLPVYLEFPEDDARRREFFTFADPYTSKIAKPQITSSMANLVAVYKAFSTPEERRDFVAYCQSSYMNGMNEQQQVVFMVKLLPVFKQFSILADGMNFFDFCRASPGVDLNDTFFWSSSMPRFIPVYKALATTDVRQDFRVFSERMLVKFIDCDRVFPIYDELTTPEHREAFLAFCQPFFGPDGTSNAYAVSDLFAIYKSNRRADFDAFMRVHQARGTSPKIMYKLRSSYMPRTYLDSMRVDAALKAESISNRIHAMHEIKIDDPLVIFNPQDPLIPRTIEDVGFANVHDFDPVYELDRPILWAETSEHNASISPTPRTIHNKYEIKTGYHTNMEVEDFISYLDTIAMGPDIQLDKKDLRGFEVASIIRQMFGLEPKKGSTSGGYDPYLSSSMYFGRSDVPLGDEMLGRTWFYMKKISKDAQELELNKKSVILALLEASEISETGVDTHCQTRTTGELMKLVAVNNLPGSHLRPLIVGADLPPAHAVDEIRERITTAALRAQQRFSIIKREEDGAIRRLLEHSYATTGEEPPLWERYEAYYDDLYRRTKNEDGIGYKLDDHILMRDDLGNLVSKYNADGSLRAEPNIVYYQSEFQVFEKTFTELMRREFEEQRGYKY